jgi:hypothetical protein
MFVLTLLVRVGFFMSTDFPADPGENLFGNCQSIYSGTLRSGNTLTMF